MTQKRKHAFAHFYQGKNRYNPIQLFLIALSGVFLAIIGIIIHIYLGLAVLTATFLLVVYLIDENLNGLYRLIQENTEKLDKNTN